MALADLNKNRSAKGLPTLPRLPALWWSMYSREWIEKAKAETN